MVRRQFVIVSGVSLTRRQIEDAIILLQEKVVPKPGQQVQGAVSHNWYTVVNKNSPLLDDIEQNDDDLLTLNSEGKLMRIPLYNIENIRDLNNLGLVIPVKRENVTINFKQFTKAQIETAYQVLQTPQRAEPGQQVKGANTLNWFTVVNEGSSRLSTIRKRLPESYLAVDSAGYLVEIYYSNVVEIRNVPA